MSMKKTLSLCAGVALALATEAGRPAAAPAEPDGRAIFRFDTFGDEQLWTGKLKMHEVIAGAVSPRTALGVGLKVDAAALPKDFLSTRNLDDPAATVEMIGLGAVVGVVGKVAQGRLESVGVTCAL